MKNWKNLLATALVATALTACLGDEENGQYGFEIFQPYDEVYGYPESYHYANQTTDTLSFLAYNNWYVAESERSGNDCSWVTIGDGNTISGKGPAYWTINVKLDKNSTGALRRAFFKLYDQEKPTDANAEFAFYQTATRLDGSLGSSPLVKQIDGDDGSVIKISYDELDRPVSLNMQKESYVRDFTIAYDHPSTSNYDRAVITQNAFKFGYRDTTYDVSPASGEGYYMASTKTGVKINTYMPYLFNEVTFSDKTLLSKTIGGNTVSEQISLQAAYQGYSYQSSYLTVDFETAFAFFDECGPIFNRQQVFANKKYSFTPDDLIQADSIILDRRFPDGQTTATNYTLTYSDTDNRATNIDANQLIFGLEACNPYALLGFFRLARFGKVISSAAYGRKSISVATELNSDKSIKTLTVSNSGVKTVYTFTY